jgi:hypothetical protein
MRQKGVFNGYALKRLDFARFLGAFLSPYSVDFDGKIRRVSWAESSRVEK